MNTKTLVIGASENKNRYSNIAIHRLLANNIEVVAIGNKEVEIAGVQVSKTKNLLKGIHTITLYLNAKNQQSYYNYIVSLNPKRVIFNPGTENADLEIILNKNNIYFEKACTLVLLSIGAY